jgi:hypothetical protein
MAKAQLTAARSALARGASQEAARVLAAAASTAEDTHTADHLRVAEAAARLRAGDPAATLRVLATIPEERRDPAFGRLAAAALMARGDLATALPLLARLAKANQPGAAAAYQSVLVHVATKELTDGRFAEAHRLFADALQATVTDPQIRLQAWLGALAAVLGLGRPELAGPLFDRFPEWSSHPMANALACRAAIVRLDLAVVDRHLHTLGRTAEAWQLQGALAHALFLAGQHEQIVLRFRQLADHPGLDSLGLSLVVLVALSLQARGRTAEARKLLERAADDPAAPPEAGYHAALLAYAAGDLQAAQARVDRLDARDPGAALLAAALRFAAGAHAWLSSRTTPQTLATLPPGAKRELLRSLAALSCVLQQADAQAAALLQDADDRSLPAHLQPLARTLRGYVALRRGAFKSASELLVGTTHEGLARLEACRDLADNGDLELALAALEPLRTRPGIAEHATLDRGMLRLALAARALAAGHADQATRELEQLERESPQLRGLVAAQRDMASVRAALQQLTAGHTEQAAQRLTQLAGSAPAGLAAQRVAPRRAALLFLAAIAHLRGAAASPVPAALAAVEAALRTAVADDPEFSPAVALLGAAMWHQNHEREAGRLLRRAWSDGLRYPVLEGLLASALIAAGRLLEGKEIAFRLLHTAPAEAATRECMMRAIAAESVQNDSAAELVADADTDNTAAAVTDPFAGTEPLSRIPILLFHLERQESQLARRDEGVALVRELKRSTVSGNVSKILELERKALAFLEGGAR